MTWDGDEYQRRFDELAASGTHVHGEADFVMRFAPATVLDAGCGTGRVAMELADRGVEVVGVDTDVSMLATARNRAPHVTWELADLVTLQLHRAFDVVVMAGNVPLFTPPGTEAAVVAGCARHVAHAGRLVAGFQLGRGYGVADYDAACTANGLTLDERWSTWDCARSTDRSDYVVSVHRRDP